MTGIQKRLRKVLAATGMSARSLSLAVQACTKKSFAASYVGALLRSDIKYAGRGHVEQLAAFLDCDPPWLTDGIGRAPACLRDDRKGSATRAA